MTTAPTAPTCQRKESNHACLRLLVGQGVNTLLKQEPLAGHDRYTHRVLLSASTAGMVRACHHLGLLPITITPQQILTDALGEAGPFPGSEMEYCVLIKVKDTLPQGPRLTVQEARLSPHFPRWQQALSWLTAVWDSLPRFHSESMNQNRHERLTLHAMLVKAVYEAGIRTIDTECPWSFVQFWELTRAYNMCVTFYHLPTQDRQRLLRRPTVNAKDTQI